MKNKTVYILGAGASRTANLPTQNGLLSLIFSIDINEDKKPSIDSDFLSLNLNDKAERVREMYSIFDEFRQNLGEFIVVNFSSSDKINQYMLAMEHVNSLTEINIAQREEFLFKAYNIVNSINVTLEDLFTIFDNVAVGREHFRLYSSDEMGKIHNQLKLCIIYALVYSITTNCDSNQYRRLSRMFLNQRLAASQKDDVIAVITLNWDDILEHALYQECLLYNSSKSRRSMKVYPDLCFYNYSLNNNPNHIPSTQIKAIGHKNIKILKMHGSLGWLECPKCGRIYTDFVKEIAVDEYASPQCPSCKSLKQNIGVDPILRSLIITPTFMKSLNNLNVKNIWHNAYIDVSEADSIVFIGYSFPDADFEMRCLLKKAVKTDVDITVVLHTSDNPQKYIEEFIKKGCTKEQAKDYISKMWLPEERYKSFFGEDKLTFYYNGIEGFLDEMEGKTNE